MYLLKFVLIKNEEKKSELISYPKCPNCEKRCIELPGICYFCESRDLGYLFQNEYDGCICQIELYLGKNTCNKCKMYNRKMDKKLKKKI